MSNRTYVPVSVLREHTDYSTDEVLEFTKYCRYERKWLKETGLEVGDRVLVIARPENKPFDYLLAYGYDEILGTEQEVRAIGAESDKDEPWGIQLRGGFWLPFNCLVKI